MKCFSIFQFETSLFLVHISKFLESIDQTLFNVNTLCNNESIRKKRALNENLLLYLITKMKMIVTSSSSF